MNTENKVQTKRPVAAGLVMADGSTFEGEYIGAIPASGISTGEVVFNTALTGYQEVITDPSYAGQIVTFTYPHIGNYGTSADDNEAVQPATRGIVIRDLARRASNWRSEQSLEAFLTNAGIGGIAGVDTRRLTRLLRVNGAMVGAFGPLEGENVVDLAALKQAAADEPGTDGVDLVAQVTTKERYQAGSGDRVIVAFDFGMKATIVSHLAQLGTVHVVPASTSAEEVLAMNPDGVFLSNGPGDPTVVTYAVATVKELLGQVPIFGICLGHQILSLAIGAKIVKLPFGHHGANHPVRDNQTGEIEITSQNHNFAVDPASLEGLAEVTHVNLNDGVCEGIRVLDGSAFSVQHHPEASPGPHDSAYLFQRFAAQMDANANQGAK